MEEKSVWVENEQLHVKNRSIAFSKINDLFIRQYNTRSKLKRALLIGATFGFGFFILHPLYAGIPAFFIITAIAYFMTPNYELRISTYNNEDIGYVESAIHHSKSADDYEDILFAYASWQERY